MARVFQKTKLNKVGGSTFRKWAEWQDGDFVVGKLVEVKEDQFGKPAFTIEVLNAEFADEKASKSFKEGSTMVLNSNGMLVKALLEGENGPVEMGTIIEVVYKGTSTITAGKYKGKESHLVEVSVCNDSEGDEQDLV
jgi:hypothetical protein